MNAKLKTRAQELNKKAVEKRRKEKEREKRRAQGEESEDGQEDDVASQVSVGMMSHKSAISNIHGRVRSTKFEANLRKAKEKATEREDIER